MIAIPDTLLLFATGIVLLTWRVRGTSAPPAPPQPDTLHSVPVDSTGPRA